MAVRDAARLAELRRLKRDLARIAQRNEAALRAGEDIPLPPGLVEEVLRVAGVTPTEARGIIEGIVADDPNAYDRTLEQMLAYPTGEPWP